MHNLYTWLNTHLYPQILMSVSLTFMIVMRMLNVSTSLDLTIVSALMDSLEMEIPVLVCLTIISYWLVNLTPIIIH